MPVIMHQGKIYGGGSSYTPRRTRIDISDRISDLILAVKEQDLEKYGFAIGDYFISPTEHTLTQEINNSTSTQSVSVKFIYHLADMNTYYGGFDSYAVLSTPHIALVVDTKITRQWHSGDASSVGYNGCKLKSYLEGAIFNAIKEDITALTGEDWSKHLLSHQKLMSTALANWAWQTGKYISALTESEVYGHREWNANGYQEGEAWKPLAIFQKFRANEIFGNMWVWLRNMQSASFACSLYSSGDSHYYAVTNAGRAAGLILFY